MNRPIFTTRSFVPGLVAIAIALAACSPPVSSVSNAQENSRATKAGIPVPDESDIPETASVATFAGGCFWCVEETFMQHEGVIAVISGYATGKKETADYKLVSAGKTKHSEAVQVHYDPKKVSFEQLVDHFWKLHDPTTLNYQGNDHGPQYRSGIYYKTEAEKKTAQASMAKLNKSGKYKTKAVTEIVPFTTFFPAEDYHQNYYRRNPDDRYCLGVLVPKLRKLGMKVID